jgi:hypothetical protein
MAQLFERQAAQLDRPQLDYADAARIVRTTMAAGERLQLEAVAVAKAVREGASNSVPAELGPDTTAGVTVLDVAYREASNLRLLWRSAEQALEMVLHNPDLSSSDAYSVLKKWRPIDSDSSKVRTAFATLAEAAIWARHLGIPALPRRGDGKYEITGLPQRQTNIDKRLKTYLLTRFAKPATDWGQTNPFVLSPATPPKAGDTPSGGTPLPPGSPAQNAPAVPMGGGGFAGGATNPGPPSLPFDQLVMAYLGAVAESDTKFQQTESMSL